MNKIKAASTVDAPMLSKDEAINMPEFNEGIEACAGGKAIIDNPYSITTQSELQKRIIPSAEWRVQFENRFQAWMYGFNSLE